MPHTWGPKAGKQFQPRQAAAAASTPSPASVAPRLLRVLFVCIGNSCRSQMAEGFARKYGSDVMEVASAGLAPATLVSPLSRQAMLESKGIDLADHWPKSLFEMHGPWDLIVNISGMTMPPTAHARQIRIWTVPDPVVDPLPVHIQVANQIETLVQQLVLELRAGKFDSTTPSTRK